MHVCMFACVCSFPLSELASFLASQLLSFRRHVGRLTPFETGVVGGMIMRILESAEEGKETYTGRRFVH